jgi:hypothetical protein
VLRSEILVEVLKISKESLCMDLCNDTETG